MEESTSKFMDIAISIGTNLIAAVIIYVVGKWIAKFLSKTTEKLMIKANVDQALAGFAKNLVYAIILVFTIIAALGSMGVETTSFAAILAAAGLAIGMALSGTLSNFASGVMIILFRPFKIGDFVDAGGVMGTVKEIKIFNTVFATGDNRKVIVPNTKISSDTITNFSDIDRRRIDLVFGISYDDDIKKAKDVLKGLVDADSRILKDPAVTIAVSELGDSCVNIICRPWVKPSDYWGVHFDLLEKAKVELEKSGCSIPYPQQDVHMHQAANAVLENA